MVCEALWGAHLDSKLRVEIGEIADTLQGNLDKVVQHGKRADAIVKNMLLHSRQGSGEHRPERAATISTRNRGCRTGRDRRFCCWPTQGGRGNRDVVCRPRRLRPQRFSDAAW
jgi:hypothetical protein